MSMLGDLVKLFKSVEVASSKTSITLPVGNSTLPPELPPQQVQYRITGNRFTKQALIEEVFSELNISASVHYEYPTNYGYGSFMPHDQGYLVITFCDQTRLEQFANIYIPKERLMDNIPAFNNYKNFMSGRLIYQ